MKTRCLEINGLTVELVHQPDASQAAALIQVGAGSHDEPDRWPAVALKLRSPDIAHKSEVQGVMLYLRNASEVEHAAEAIFDRVKQTLPQARIEGLLVQSMASRAGAQELRVVVEQDALFGPIIMLGEGGVEWQADKQAAVALPPLNMTLARYLVIQAIKSGKIRSRSALNPLDIPAV